MMKAKIYSIKPLSTEDKNQEQKFWRFSFFVYAAAEVFIISIQYAVTRYQCENCVLPPAFYPLTWLQHLVFTAALWLLLNRFYNITIWKMVVLNSVLFAALHFLWVSLQYAIFHSAPQWLVSADASNKSFRLLLYGSWPEIGKYAVKASAFYLLKFYKQYRQAEKQRIQLAMINKDLQLDLLKKQLSPHFYFNTLNNLYGLARANSQKLPVALSQLSNIMGYVITDCNHNKVLLAEEIRFLQSYIALEKLRYEHDTVIEMQVEGKMNGQMIIPLVLIQFVENAFKHGMKEKSAENWMKVKLQIIKEQLIFIVENSYYEKSPAAGIGISSVKDILTMQYEGKHDLKMEYHNNCFLVNLKLNLL
jgi:sensor histidine kinase YesM